MQQQPPQQSASSLDVSSRSSQRLVPEDDVKSERERWLQTCMHEVWNMENAAFERINEQIEQATLRLQSEVTAAVLKQVEIERHDRSTAIADLRKDLSASQSSVDMQMQIQALRRDFAAAQSREPRPSNEARSGDAQMQGAQLQAGLSAVQAQMEQHRLQLIALEAAMADNRSELGLQRERQEFQSSAALTDLRQELSTVQMAHMQALQDQAARSAADLSQGIRDVHSMLEAALGPVKAELKQDVEKLRGDLEVERKQVDELGTQVVKLEGAGSGVSDRFEELGRKLAELQQDQLSETTILRSRVEAAVGDRAENQSQTDNLQLLIKEEQGRRSVEVAALQARLDAVERISASVPTVVTAPAPAPTVSAGVVEALQAEVAVLRVRLEKAEALNPGPKLLADLQVVTKRVEQVEATVGSSSAASHSHAASEAAALRAGLDAVRSDMARLSQDLTDERRDRCRALSDVNRITEEISKAAAATIERAERRFAAEMHSDQWESRSDGSRKTRSAADDSTVANRSNPEVSLTPSTTEDVRSALGHSMAKLVGEMDAELRVELTSRIRLITAELRGEILSEVAVRIAGMEGRVTVIENNVGTEMQQMAQELSSKITALEAIQAGPRLVSLEEEAKCTSRTLVFMLEERKKKAAEFVYNDIEAKCQNALAIGKATGSTAEPRSSNGSTTSPMHGSLLEAATSPSSSKLHSPAPETLAYAGEGQNFASCLKQSFEDGMKKSIDNIMNAATRSPSRQGSTKPGAATLENSRTLSSATRGYPKHSSRSPDGLRGNLPDARLAQRPLADSIARQRLDEAGPAKAPSDLPHRGGKDLELLDTSTSSRKGGLLRSSHAREAASADQVAPLRASGGSAPHNAGAASADPVATAMRGASSDFSLAKSPELRGRPSATPVPAAAPSGSAVVQGQPQQRMPSSSLWTPGQAVTQPVIRGGVPSSVSPTSATAVRPQAASSNTWSLFRGRAVR